MILRVFFGSFAPYIYYVGKKTSSLASQDHRVLLPREAVQLVGSVSNYLPGFYVFIDPKCLAGFQPPTANLIQMFLVVFFGTSVF